MSSKIAQLNALVSLNAIYTDSEVSDEEEELSKLKFATPDKQNSSTSVDHTSEDDSHSRLLSYATQAIYTDSEVSDLDEGSSEKKYCTPIKKSDRDNTSKVNSHLKLVPYAKDKAIIEDETADSEDSYTSLSDNEDGSTSGSDSRRNVFILHDLLDIVQYHRNLMGQNDIQLPPEPKGKCSKSLQKKFRVLYQKKRKGKDVNFQMQKNYRNPSINEKLIEFCDIDEYGTNYPPETYDPHIWYPGSYYDDLPKSTVNKRKTI